MPRSSSTVSGFVALSSPPGRFCPCLRDLRPRLRAVDEATTVPERELELVASVPFFEPLAPTTLEKLALRLRPLHVRAGTAVVKEGEGGETFYCFPGGRVEPGETWEEAAIREAREELGVEARLERLVATFHLTWSGNVAADSEGRYYLATAVGGVFGVAERAEPLDRRGRRRRTARRARDHPNRRTGEASALAEDP